MGATILTLGTMSAKVTIGAIMRKSILGLETTVGAWDTQYVINENNTDRYPLVNVYWNIGDINHDLKVDMIDVASVAKSFGSYPSFPNWNCHSDITGPLGTSGSPDGKTDMRDVAAVAKHYGEKYGKLAKRFLQKWIFQLISCSWMNSCQYGGGCLQSGQRIFL